MVAVGTSRSWANPGTSGNWNTAANWSPSGVPGSLDTVTIGASGNRAYTVTVNTAASVASLTITGGTGSHTTELTLTTGNSLATSGAITLANANSILDGAGSINASGGITGAGTLQAGTSSTGGTLDVTGTIASGVVLAIGTTAASDLKIEGTATSAAPISLTSANQTLEIGASGALTINSGGNQQDVSGAHIVLDGGTLADTDGFYFHHNATIAGNGTLNVGTSNGLSTSGTPTITASNGTLNLVGDVDFTNLNANSQVVISTASASTLEFSGGTSTIGAISISNANQTLQVGAGGNVTIADAVESITNGHIVLSGGTLTDTFGLTIGTGATLSGYGIIGTGTAVTGAGTITANTSGQTLEIQGAVDGAARLALSRSLPAPR